MDVEQIALGTFSPITGFMNKEEIELVLHKYKLLNNVVWPLPIFLQINKKYFEELKIGDEVILRLENTNEDYATILIDDLLNLPNKIDQIDEIISINRENKISKINFTVSLFFKY